MVQPVQLVTGQSLQPTAQQLICRHPQWQVTRNCPTCFPGASPAPILLFSLVSCFPLLPFISSQPVWLFSRLLRWTSSVFAEDATYFAASWVCTKTGFTFISQSAPDIAGEVKDSRAPVEPGKVWLSGFRSFQFLPAPILGLCSVQDSLS